MPELKLAASILNADFGYLADQVQQAESAGVDYIHLDVMDGHFVPNITFGFVVLEAIRRNTHLPLDVHLMIEQPERYLREFAAFGPKYITVHQEAVERVQQTVDEIRSLGVGAGLAVSPPTPLSTIEEACSGIDLLLVMTINPGFGGQQLMPATIDKVSRARELLDRCGSRAALEVDGGIKTHNVAELVRAGAETLVVGTGIFHSAGGIASGVAKLRRALEAVKSEK